jgi:hypothetical protein
VTKQLVRGRRLSRPAELLDFDAFSKPGVGDELRESNVLTYGFAKPA